MQLFWHQISSSKAGRGLKYKLFSGVDINSTVRIVLGNNFEDIPLKKEIRPFILKFSLVLKIFQNKLDHTGNPSMKKKFSQKYNRI